METEVFVERVKAEYAAREETERLLPGVELASNFEELTEKFNDLATRICAFRPSFPDRPVDLGGEQHYVDRTSQVKIPTEDKAVPEVIINFHSGHHSDEKGRYNPSDASVISSKQWVSKITNSDWHYGSATKEAVLKRPTEHTNVEEAAVELGHIEEAVIAAEEVVAAEKLRKRSMMVSLLARIAGKEVPSVNN